MDAESEQASGSTQSHIVDVFGTVESNSKSGNGHGHTREAVESSPPSSPLFTPLPRRTSSRRAHSVDLSAQHSIRQPAVPSPLGPARRKRGEREGHERRREKDTLRAELDASAAVAPGLALDPRIASDVLALERRFAAASKGKSPATRTPRTHRPRHSLPVTPNRTDLLSNPNRSSTIEPLASLPESSTGDEPSTTVEPARPSSAIEPATILELEPSTPRSGPPPIRIDKPAYLPLLPASEPEPVSSGTDAVKRGKRTSLTAMFGITRKKDKDLHAHAHAHDKETDSDLSRLPSPPRPIAIRADTHRTTNTVLTAYTTATAGSDDRSLSHGHSGGGSPLNLSPAAIEPSAKTLARAAATRDQLAKRYAILYAGLGGSSGGGDTGSTISTPVSLNSHSSSKFVRGLGTNPLEVIRWRSAKPKPQPQPQLEYERTDEIWEREVERRIRDYPPPQPLLGDSLPEATSLSWLPYLEPVFAEERGGADTGEDVGAGARMGGPRRRPMTAWYVLASFVEDYISSALQGEEDIEDPLPTPRPIDTSPTPSNPKVTSDVRAQAIVNAARNAGLDVGEGSRFGLIDRALRTRSRQSSVGADSGTGTGATTGVRSRHSSVGVGSASLGGGTIGMMSEPPSPSHVPTSNSKFLNPSPTNDAGTRAGRSHSGSSQPNTGYSHSRSQSQARSLSGGNGNGSVDWGKMGEGKSMSPASSKMNLANFIMGGAAVLGLNMRRRPPGSGTGLGKEVVSGSENESARVSSDVSPIPSDVDHRYGRGGMSDGEGGRVKRRKKTWREEAERVPLSDGAGSGSGERRGIKKRTLRQSTTVMVPIEIQPEKEQEERDKVSLESREREKEYARKRIVVDDTHDVLSHVNERLRNFVDLANYLNSVHDHGSDIFGDMIMPIPLDVVSALVPDLPEEDGSHSRTPTATSPLTPTPHSQLSAEALASFTRHLEGKEKPIAIDAIGRSTLDANLPIRAFEVLHALDHRLQEISTSIRSLKQICDDAEVERRDVKKFYEITAESVETTYPECTQIERLLGSLVTEDMPWLPSWLPLWVRHLLEIFSNQIQFLVENGLRIYGYVYHVVSIVVLLFSLVLKVFFMFGRFIRSIWWVFAVAAISGATYLMMYPPEGISIIEESL